MDAAIWLAIIVAVPAIITGSVVPVILNFLNNRSARQQRLDEVEARRLEKAEDWRRQDDVAAKLHEQQERTAAKAAEAVEIAKGVSVKIDGMLADRDKANVEKGENKEAARGKDVAAALREGQLQGVADERASRESLVLAASDTPVKVADKLTQDATERSANALERTADAAENAARNPDSKENKP